MHRFNRYLGAGDKEAGYNLSWGAVFAGVVTFIALIITLGFIGNAIGFGTVSPKASDPMSGVGTGLLIWTVIQLILSFLGAGFVAGVTARRVGVVHGFLTWAVSTIATFILLSVAPYRFCHPLAASSVKWPKQLVKRLKVLAHQLRIASQMALMP